MTKILIIMSFGILTGFLLRHRQKLIFIVEKTTGFSIYILLFLLGISVGSNNTVVSNFEKIGFNAIIISLSSTTGSILLASLLYRLFFIQDKN